MKALPFCCRGAAALVVVAAFSGQAKGIPVIYGHGETIAHVGELPGNVKQEVSRKLGHDVSIGFLYNRLHIFWLNFWTWDGRHVLYAGDQCWELEPADWEGLLGREAAASLSKPFLYRFPLGLIIVGGLVVFGVVVSWLFPSDAARARKLLKDERYQQALRTYSEKVSPPADSAEAQAGQAEAEAGQAAAQAAQAESPEAAFKSAVEHLRSNGVPPDEAEQNMQLILRLLAAQAQQAAQA